MPETLHDGRYALLEPLGQGASGMTWRARDERSGRVVVVKERFATLGDDGARREREAEVLSTLRHPCIPAFVDAFVAPVRGLPRLHLVMEHIEGTSLEDERHARRYTVPEALDVARQVLRVLVYLQDLSPPLVHRDVKPANLMRRPDGTVVLLDFGLAVEGAHRTFGHTMAAGTLGYQAPEQIRGEPVPASDVYGVAVILWTLLTRIEPHTRLQGQGLDWRPPAAHLPEAVVQWLEQALAPVERRFANARAALEALERVDRHPGGPEPSTTTQRPPEKRRPRADRSDRTPAGKKRRKKRKDKRRGESAELIRAGRRLARAGTWLRWVYKWLAKLIDKLT